MTAIDDSIRIETPEGVVLSAVLADPLSRALAFLIDALLIIVLLVASAWLLLALPSKAVGKGLFSIVAFLLIWGYFFLCEWLLEGATFGKRRMNLQVVGADLLPLSAAQAAWRNVLRPLDWLPFAYGLGIVALLSNNKNQRLGDWMAGTVVIFKRSPQVRQQALPPGEAFAPEWRLSREEQRAIVDFARYSERHHESRLIELSAPLAAKMSDCDAQERVRRLRAWGRWLAGSSS